MNGKTDEERVADMQKALRELRELARQAEEAGIQVRLKTRTSGTPGAIKDTILTATRFLAGLRVEEDDDPTAD
ncbi:hypothetical protein LCGC14_2718350 [marine sediment metagenome]|uniref:Uncharacterized protein n=1 Tax=marine sediment metagenome TaxID=412755 RepID=A0A0F8ZAT5_9ZZZZ